MSILRCTLFLFFLSVDQCRKIFLCKHLIGHLQQPFCS